MQNYQIFFCLEILLSLLRKVGCSGLFLRPQNFILKLSKSLKLLESSCIVTNKNLFIALILGEVDFSERTQLLFKYVLLLNYGR